MDWEGAHLFLELVRRGSFRAAAESLGMSFNALRSRITAFEQSLGVMLITRHVDGIRLTVEGEEIFAGAEEMERAAIALVRSRDRTVQTVEGEVRLAISEGLGTLWVATHLVSFQRANPKLLLDVNCAMKSADVLRLEADIAVQLTRPTAQDLKMVRLGRLHCVPFASQSYLNIYGTPASVMDYPKHRVVIQADDMPLWRQIYDQFFPGVRPEGLVSLRTNVSSAQYWSIVQGAGIGVLPTYVYAMGAPVVPLDLGIVVPVDIWMTYHEGAARIPRVRSLADWLVSIFSSKTYPWFRDEYIPPQDLFKHYKGQLQPNPFAGLIRVPEDDREP
jgi:DNA-binding transcriptional LysR family regulator